MNFEDRQKLPEGLREFIDNCEIIQQTSGGYFTEGGIEVTQDIEYALSNNMIKIKRERKQDTDGTKYFTIEEKVGRA